MEIVHSLREAEELIIGPRAQEYGHPLDNFERIGRAWGMLLDRPDIPPEMVAVMMVGVKIARSVQEINWDTIVDIAGYAGTIERIITERERRDAEGESDRGGRGGNAQAPRGASRTDSQAGGVGGGKLTGYL